MKLPINIEKLLGGRAVSVAELPKFHFFTKQVYYVHQQIANYKQNSNYGKMNKITICHSPNS